MSSKFKKATSLIPKLLKPLKGNDEEESSDFIKIKNGSFELKGKKYIPCGPNAYWMGLHETYNFPRHAQIDEVFDVTKWMSGTCIRSHTLGVSTGNWNSVYRKDGELNPDALDIVDYVIKKATETGIKLLIPLTDAYAYYHGNYGHYCDVAGYPKNTFFKGNKGRAEFKKHISFLLNRTNKLTGRKYKDEPAILAWELGNELGNYRPSATSTAVPQKEWSSDIVSYIRGIDKNHLILCPSDECLGSGESRDFEVPFDFYSGHFYGYDYNRIQYGVNESSKKGVPYILGEYSSHFDESFFKKAESLGVQGSFFWSLYPHKTDGSPLPHNDGFTMHYPENKDQLNVIKKHFKRLQES